MMFRYIGGMQSASTTRTGTDSRVARAVEQVDHRPGRDRDRGARSGRLSTTVSSTGARAVRRRRSAPPSTNARTRRGSHAVEITTGRNMNVWNSFIGTPYQPTTSGRVRSESISASTQR